MLAKPEVKDGVRQQGAEPMTSTPAEFAAQIVDGKKQWAEVIRMFGCPGRLRRRRGERV